MNNSSKHREVYIDPLSILPFSYSRENNETEKQYADRIAELEEESIPQFDNNYLVTRGKIQELENLLAQFPQL